MQTLIATRAAICLPCTQLRSPHFNRVQPQCMCYKARLPLSALARDNT